MPTTAADIVGWVSGGAGALVLAINIIRWFFKSEKPTNMIKVANPPLILCFFSRLTLLKATKKQLSDLVEVVKSQSPSLAKTREGDIEMDITSALNLVHTSPVEETRPQTQGCPSQSSRLTQSQDITQIPRRPSTQESATSSSRRGSVDSSASFVAAPQTHI